MAMRTIQQEQLPALRGIACQLRQLCRSFSAEQQRNGTRHDISHYAK
jgi:hypothetical protein